MDLYVSYMTYDLKGKVSGLWIAAISFLYSWERILPTPMTAVVFCRRRRLPVWRLGSARARSARYVGERPKTRRQHIPVLPNGPWLKHYTSQSPFARFSRDVKTPDTTCLRCFVKGACSPPRIRGEGKKGCARDFNISIDLIIKILNIFLIKYLMKVICCREHFRNI